ncbi:MAG: hypothetical protein DCC58_06460, partial [Chloroflexi bacterium]
FSLGLERVLAASSRTFATDLQPAVLVLVGKDAPAAVRLAAALRAAGWSAALDVRGRNEQATRRAAERQGFRALARRSENGIDIVLVPSGAVRRFAAAPAPAEVLAE